MVKKPKTEVHIENKLPPCVLSGRVSPSSSGDSRVPYLRKSLSVDMAEWQEDIDVNKIILHCVRKLMKNK